MCGVVLAIGIWNAPIPGFRSAYQDALRTPYQLVRLDQGWSYFSPDVGRISPEVWVEIERSDGTRDRWDFPDEFPVFGTFRGYRWIKFDEAVAFGPPRFEAVLDYVQREAPGEGTIVGLDLVIAISAPTAGSHGPYEPDYTIEIVASREVRP